MESPIGITRSGAISIFFWAAAGKARQGEESGQDERMGTPSDELHGSAD